MRWIETTWWHPDAQDAATEAIRLPALPQGAVLVTSWANQGDANRVLALVDSAGPLDLSGIDAVDLTDAFASPEVRAQIGVNYGLVPDWSEQGIVDGQQGNGA